MGKIVWTEVGKPAMKSSTRALLESNPSAIVPVTVQIGDGEPQQIVAASLVEAAEPVQQVIPAPVPWHRRLRLLSQFVWASLRARFSLFWSKYILD